MQVVLKILLDRVNENVEPLVRRVLRARLRRIDSSIRLSHVGNYPAIACSVYLPDLPLQNDIWQDFYSALTDIKIYVEETGIQVSQIIVGRSDPSFSSMRNRHGFWISTQDIQNTGLLSLLKESGAYLVDQEWFFLPFSPNDTDDDSEYELCLPDERIRELGSRMNGSVGRPGVPIGLRIRMAKGYRISDYVAATFESMLKSTPHLGGANVILTTLLQMNNKIGLVNHYSERLSQSEELELCSLSAMNLSLVDDRDETNIAILVASEKLIIEDIRLGG